MYGVEAKNDAKFRCILAAINLAMPRIAFIDFNLSFC